MIYLDNAATTKIAREVLDAMMPWLTDKYGNPGGVYAPGREAKAAVEYAREQVARLFNARPGDIVFTSGGSESNAMVFRCSMTRLHKHGRCHVVVSAIEHDSIRNLLAEMEEDGLITLTVVPPEPDGTVSPAKIEDAIRPETGLVSVMYMNNETGAVNDVKAIGEICHRHHTAFHTDCVQAAGCEEIDVRDIHCEYASISSHKIHGPKGVGALYHRNEFFGIEPMIAGGSEQEFGIRGGTENVAGIVGFGKACELVTESLSDLNVHRQRLEDAFLLSLRTNLDARGLLDRLHMNTPRCDKILNMRLDGVDGETLLLMLDSAGVCVSAGSACRSHEQEPSYVLTAMGIDPEDARNSIRVSFSRMNTDEEVAKAGAIIADCADRIVRMQT